MRIELYKPLYIHELGNRSNQEDALWRKDATEDDRLFIVCDGMGGHEKGEVASQTFCQALGVWFTRNGDSRHFSDEQLGAALEYAYEQLDLKDDDCPNKMGTTLTLLYFHKGGVIAAHIGDSRIYHIRPSEGILYQSRDHSLVFELFQYGEISYEEMATHPKKNIITRAVTPGKDNRAKPDIIHITDIQPGDYFYLCSDGMLEQMSNEELLQIFSSSDSDEKKRMSLIAATVDNADNHTAWLLHVKTVTREESDPLSEINEEEEAVCNVVNIIRKWQQANVESSISNDVEVVAVQPSAPRVQSRPFPYKPDGAFRNKRLSNLTRIPLLNLRTLLYSLILILLLIIAILIIKPMIRNMMHPKSALIPDTTIVDSTGSGEELEPVNVNVPPGTVTPEGSP